MVEVGSGLEDDRAREMNTRTKQCFSHCSVG